MKIIENKYTDEIIYDFPSTSVELLGFYYSIMWEKQNEIKFIEPFFPVINNKSTMKEAIKEENNNIIYVEPIFFNKHVSILYFTFINKIRYNYLVDFSLYHSSSILGDNAVFSNNMRSKLIIFPKHNLQNGPTCSIWFISQILLALNHGSDIFSKTFDYKYINIFFLIDYINKIYKIDKNPLIFAIGENIKSESINISIDPRCFLSHKVAFASFLNINSLLTELKINVTCLGYFLDEIIDKFENIRNFICTLKYNKEYYELLEVKSDITEEKIDIYKKEFIELKNDFENCVTSIKKLYEKTGKDKEYKIEKLKRDLIYKLNTKLEKYMSKVESCFYEKETIKDLYRNKNSIFSPLTN